MLVHVSAGYLPVRGWLHTCYSPVRRSPPVYCYTVLPLDLHVLSLSLAFILSQDQTLHTKKSYRNFLWPGHVFMNLDYRRFRFTLATFCSSQYLKELFISCFLSLVLRVKADAKIRPFFVTFQIFFKVFSNFFLKSLVIRYFELLKQKKDCLISISTFQELYKKPPF